MMRRVIDMANESFNNTAMDTLLPAIPVLVAIMVSVIGLSLLTNQTSAQMDSIVSQQHDVAANIQTMTTAASGGSTDPTDSASKGVSCTYRGDGSRSCEPRDGDMNITNWFPVLAIAIIGGLAIYFVFRYIGGDEEEVKKSPYDSGLGGISRK